MFATTVGTKGKFSQGISQVNSHPKEYIHDKSGFTSIIEEESQGPSIQLNKTKDKEEERRQNEKEEQNLVYVFVRYKEVY